MSDKKKNIVTPAGTLLFPTLNKPDDKFANGDPTKASYSTLFIIPEEQVAELIESLEAQYEEFYKDTCKKEKKSKLKRADLPWGTNTDAEGEEVPGELRMRFKMKSTTSKGVKMRPVLLDAKKNPINHETTIIGNGSVAKISFQPYFWFVPTMGVGLTLQIRGVQILELKEFTGGDCGFDEEEGYEASAAEDDFGGGENGDF